MEEAVAETAGKRWARLLSPYQASSDARAFGELAVTVIPYVAIWILMLKALDWGYAWSLALAPLGGLMLIRIFIIQHDCGHGSFFTSTRLNDMVGSILGVISFTPYFYWRRTHSIHHATSGNLDKRAFGDIETLTVEEYRALSPLGRLNYRLYRHPIVFLFVGPMWQFVVKHRLPLDAPWSWRKEWRSVLVTNLGMVAGFMLLGETIGYLPVILVQFPLLAIAGPIGIWLFFIQHQYEGAYWQRSESWDYYEAALKGSSFYDLPAVLHWFTGNIGLHHIHHLDSRIPCYRLQECQREVPDLQEVEPLGVWESLGCARLKLWDEEAGRLVGFDAAAV